jgi:hypothetical protein
MGRGDGRARKKGRIKMENSQDVSKPFGRTKLWHDVTRFFNEMDENLKWLKAMKLEKAVDGDKRDQVVGSLAKSITTMGDVLEDFTVMTERLDDLGILDELL